MTSIFWATLSFIGFIGMTALGDLLSEEVRDRLDHLPHAILRLADSRLNSGQRIAFYEDEWLPELTYILKGAEARPITCLITGSRYALGILISASRIGRYLRRTHPVICGTAESGKEQTGASQHERGNRNGSGSVTRIRNALIRADARWAVAGGAAAFTGPLLPFISLASNSLYSVGVSTDFQTGASVFGLIIIGLGVAVSYRPTAGRLASIRTIILAVALLLLSGLMDLGYGLFAAAGLIGTQESTGIGTVTVSFSPGIGMILAMMGAAAGCVGAVLSLAHISTAPSRKRSYLG
jgi:hypothetical protein